MPIIVMNIQTPPSATNEDKIDAALKAVSLSQSDIENAGIYKSSIDARKRTDIHFVSSVMLTLKSKALEEKLCRRYKNVKYVEELHLNPTISKEKRSGRVVISGFGPCGMFCALLLSEYGYKPIVLERGADVDERVKAVEGFWSGKELDERTNVQFGEGGAGTFSDGKLTTRINDPLIRYVLKRFCEFGAPKEILYEAKPHLGTDNLRGIVKGIRQRIIDNGGEIRFKTKLTDFTLQNGQLRSVATEHDSIEASALVLAIGHSARDTFEMLLNKGMILAPKPFSVGARIEHTQKSVDESLYGSFSGSAGLPKGEYQLSLRKPDGRAVYTFCMCPGGSVVAAQSELNTVVTNGMSEHSRDKENANSALVVSVSPNDFGSNPLDGVKFARQIEQRAFALSGGYRAPASTVGDFIGDSSKPSVTASYKPGVVPCNLNKLFPKLVSDMMKEGIHKFSSEMKCFADKGAMLTAPETRTSSPVRITRDENMCALGVSNIYPAGEGAGYAGGIMSAAVDGLKAAMAIMASFAPNV